MTVANQLAPGVEYPPLDDLVFFALVLGTPAIVGVLLRERGLVVGELAARAQELRAAREEQAAAAVAEERARVTMGVHDALAHRIGEISLQAAGAQRVAVRAPDAAQRALARIEDAARAALDDIRETIGVLRRDERELGLAPPHAPAGAVPAPWPAAAPPSEDPAPEAARPRASRRTRSWPPAPSPRSRSRPSPPPSSRARCRRTSHSSRWPPPRSRSGAAPAGRRAGHDRGDGRAGGARDATVGARHAAPAAAGQCLHRRRAASAATGAGRPGDLRRRHARRRAVGRLGRDRAARLGRRTRRARPRRCERASCARSRARSSGRATPARPAPAARSGCGSRASCTTQSPMA